MKIRITNKNNFDYKIGIFASIGLTYYFFTSLILFRPSFVKTLQHQFLFEVDFYLLIILSFIMAVFWLIINIVLSMFLIYFNQNIKYKNSSDVFLNSIFYSVGFLSVALLISYILDYDFRHFIAYANMFLSVRILLVILKFAYKKV